MRFRFLAALIAAATISASLASAQGCSGGEAALGQVRVKVAAVVQAQPIRSGLARVEENRPHVLAHLAGAFFGHVRSAADHAQANHEARLAARSTSCGGGTAFAPPNCGVTVKLSCTGGGYSQMPVGVSRTVVILPAPTVQVAPAVKVVPAAPPVNATMQAGPARRVLLRAELNHAINHAERTGKLSSDEAAKARSVMADSDLRGQLIGKVEAMGPTASASTHPFLDWLMANLPTIIAEIMKLFGH